MKIYFNSDFTITKREYEEYFLGSEYHNKIEVYFPMTTYGNYTYIYPVFNVKRPDDRKFGEFALTEYNVENDYIVWRADLPSKALEIEGTLEITILFRYSTDNKYAKVSTGKVLLNVKEAVIGEENDVIFTGSGDNLQGEIDAIRNEFGVRFNNVETRFISNLEELDNYKTPGIYRFNYNNANVFDLYITRTYQIRSSSNGYYRRSYNSNDGFGEWIFNEYSVNGSTQWNAEIQYSKGDIVRNNAVYVCITDNKGYIPEEDDENNPLYWIKFEPENYILKEEGKGLSTNDLTNELLAKLNSLKNYDDTAINNKITAIERILASDNVDLDTLQEIVDVLEENEGDINAIFTAIAKKVDKDGLKTINGESIVGSGNIVIKGGSGNVIDLSNYYNKTEIDSKVNAKEDKANLKALAYKDSLTKTDIGLGNVRNVESYSKTETDEKISDVIEIAEGKTKTFVVSTESNIKFKSNTDQINLDISANPIVDISGKTINIDDIKVGDIFYVLEKEVADRWVSSITGNIIELPKMETSKVNLDEYYNKTEISDLVNEYDSQLKTDIAEDYYNKTETDALLPKTIDLGLVENGNSYPLPEGKTIDDFTNADIVNIITPINNGEAVINSIVELHKSGNVQGMAAVFYAIGLNMSFQLNVSAEGYSLSIGVIPQTWFVEEISSYQDHIFYRAYEGGKSNTYDVYGNKIKLNGTTYNPFDFTQSKTIDIDTAIDNKIANAIGNALEADY